MASQRFWICLLLILSSVVLLAASRQPMVAPDNDSLQYLGYARSLHLAGTYAATVQGPAADSGPGREPLYSAVVALTAKTVPSLAAALDGCLPPQQSCLAGFRALIWLNAVLWAGAAILACQTVAALGGSRLAIAATGAYLALNAHVYKDMRYAISDFLAVFLVALASWLLVMAVTRGRTRWWLGAALAVAGLCLVKGTFLLFGAALAAGLTLAGLRQLRDRGVSALFPAVSVAVVMATLAGGWLVRNQIWFGRTGDERGVIALSTREVFDHMTLAEHAAAWLWWTRGPGDDLAKRLLPSSAWRRHEWYEPDGFYTQGQVVRHDARMALVAKQHPSASVGERQGLVMRQVMGEILAEAPSYLATMPVLFYRGLWVDEFIVLGLPALAMVLVGAWRSRRWDVTAALALGCWSLMAYPALSLNLPRYQMTALVALAIAGGLGAQHLVEKIKGRHRR